MCKTGKKMDKINFNIFIGLLESEKKREYFFG